MQRILDEDAGAHGNSGGGAGARLPPPGRAGRNWGRARRSAGKGAGSTGLIHPRQFCGGCAQPGPLARRPARSAGQGRSIGLRCPLRRPAVAEHPPSRRGQQQPRSRRGPRPPVKKVLRPPPVRPVPRRSASRPAAGPGKFTVIDRVMAICPPRGIRPVQQPAKSPSRVSPAAWHRPRHATRPCNGCPAPPPALLETVRNPGSSRSAVKPRLALEGVRRFDQSRVHVCLPFGPSQPGLGEAAAHRRPASAPVSGLEALPSSARLFTP